MAGYAGACTSKSVAVHGRAQVLGTGEVAVVAQGGVGAGVAEDALHAVDVRADFQQVGGAGLPEVVDAEPGTAG